MARKCTIGELEALLLGKYPRQDACDWDRTGLLAGDPEEPVTGVAVALDPTFSALEQAKEKDANVLLTHHPAFLQPPESFVPGKLTAQRSGSLVYAAIRENIALMNFHTALDMNEDGLFALPRALGLAYCKTVEPLSGASETGRGYGALCVVGDVAALDGAAAAPGASEGGESPACGSDDSAPGAADRVCAGTVSVMQLAQRCKQVLGGWPRVWGDGNVAVCRVVTAQGSAGSLLHRAFEQGADCLICGELKYHDAQAYAQAGLNIIELGHDVSEFPLVHALYRAVCDGGIENVVELPQRGNAACL